MDGQRRAPVAALFAVEPLEAGRDHTLGEDAAHHLRVLRAALGDPVSLHDGAGTVATGTLVRIARASVVVAVAETREVPPQPAVHVAVPVADRERMLWLGEKCAELGVSTWRPIVWRRSRSVNPRGEGTMFQQKLRARMILALLQSRGAWLPEIFPDATVERAAASAPDGTRLLLDGEGGPALSAMGVAPVTVVIGPEGGVEEAERQLLVGAGFVPVSLGSTILRFETAGVAGVALARAALAVRENENG